MIGKINEDVLLNLNHLNEICNNINLFYKEFYLLDNRQSGKLLRQQIKDLKLIADMIKYDSIDTGKMRKAIKFKVSKIQKEKYSKLIKNEFNI